MVLQGVRKLAAKKAVYFSTDHFYQHKYIHFHFVLALNISCISAQEQINITLYTNAHTN